MNPLGKIITVAVLLAAGGLTGFGAGAVFSQSHEMEIGASVVLNGPREEAIVQTSTVVVNPSILPVGGTALVTVTVYGEGGIPLEGLSIRLECEGPDGVVIQQPGLPTNADGQAFGSVMSMSAGLVTVRAVVTSYDHEIPIADYDVVLFEPVYVPVMQAEPQFTRGTSNTLSWSGNTQLYQFELVRSRDMAFTQGVVSTGWIGSITHEFGGLEDGVLYYYRVRARNKYGLIGEWSNVVYSIQDASPPIAVVESAEQIDDGFHLSISAQDSVSGVSFVEVFARRNSGEWVSVAQVVEDELTVLFEEIVGGNPFLWNGEFCFYTNAADNVGNREPGAEAELCIRVAEDLEPDEPDEPVGPTPPQPPSFGEQLIDFSQYVWDETTQAIETLYREQGKRFETVLVTVPVVSTVVTVLTALKISLADLPVLLSELIAGIGVLLGLLSKRQPWGIVYDSLTKEPITRAVVRLYENRRLVQTVVTDNRGIFSFNVSRGDYTLSVQRRGYLFPSRVIIGTVDGIRLNIYHGGVYSVRDDNEQINLNVPLDPEEMKLSRRLSVTLMNLMGSVLIVINPVLLGAGAVFSAVCFIVLNLPLYSILAVVNTALLVWHIYSRMRSRERWGRVVDEQGKPVAGIPIGLYDTKYGRIIDERVTDELGRYRFVVEGGEYVIKPRRGGWIADRGDGYPVGRSSKGAIIITDQIVLRQVRSAR